MDTGDVLGAEVLGAEVLGAEVHADVRADVPRCGADVPRAEVRACA
jgi:hypothetical protein